ncbi:MAG: DUF2283 domain-containing protein [Bifidobacteriaceae bacterium]|jgi:uncharacterized protein YuzE|nr:DUF2283 domain-containing protein [Bifidobacteriaceae bacterium]
MFASFDKQADAAYIAFGDSPIGAGEVATTVHSIATPSGSAINLDFDSRNRLLGIEVLNATKVLPQELLVQAKKPPLYAGWWPDRNR